jgi:hypothetical protein
MDRYHIYLIEAFWPGGNGEVDIANSAAVTDK